MRILFFGTPAYTTSYLDTLSELAEIVGVVTMPAKAAGRGRHERQPAPAKWAIENQVPLFQPATLKEPALVSELSGLKPDVGIVVAYGKIIPRNIFTIPPQGTLNLHFSLLPNFRGASPIESALLCGNSKSGVTMQKITEQLDAGDILSVQTVDITPEDHFPELFEKLFTAGDQLLKTTLTLLQENNAKFTPQNEADAVCCSKIKNQERQIEWDQSAQDICNRIRAFSGHRTCYTLFQNKKMLLHRACVADIATTELPGTVLQADKKGLIIACATGAISITEIQRENKKKMDYIAFTNSNLLKQGDRLS